MSEKTDVEDEAHQPRAIAHDSLGELLENSTDINAGSSSSSVALASLLASNKDDREKAKAKWADYLNRWQSMSIDIPKDLPGFIDYIRDMWTDALFPQPDGD